MKSNRKRILFFMPDSPVRRDAGNKMRAFKLLEYFASRPNIELDFVSEKNWGGWTETDAINFRNRFPNIGLHVFDRKGNKRNLLSYVFGYKIPEYIRKHKFMVLPPPLPDNNTQLLQSQFNQLLREERYDYIIISYTTWATLVKDNPFTGSARLIIDTHDFITSQIKKKKGFRLGAAFAEEMRRLSYFDEIWSLSVEENYLFRQFTTADHRIVPMMQDQPDLQPEKARKFDLIYIASHNEHNILSINWFFLEVYPLLPPSIKICIIGSIGDHIPENLPNVTKIPFAEDTTVYYQQSRIAMSPMFGGTGIKVKTVEALAHGLPVVSTPDGVIGLPDKTNNGCIVGHNAEEFAAHIMALCNSPALLAQLSRHATSMFNRHFETENGFDIMDMALGQKRRDRPMPEEIPHDMLVSQQTN